MTTCNYIYMNIYIYIDEVIEVRRRLSYVLWARVCKSKANSEWWKEKKMSWIEKRTRRKWDKTIEANRCLNKNGISIYFIIIIYDILFFNLYWALFILTKKQIIFRRIKYEGLKSQAVFSLLIWCLNCIQMTLNRINIHFLKNLMYLNIDRLEYHILFDNSLFQNHYWRLT